MIRHPHNFHYVSRTKVFLSTSSNPNSIFIILLYPIDLVAHQFEVSLRLAFVEGMNRSCLIAVHSLMIISPVIMQNRTLLTINMNITCKDVVYILLKICIRNASRQVHDTNFLLVETQRFRAVMCE